MVKEAVEQSRGKTISNKEIQDYIIDRYGSINRTTINCQILVCTVNAPSRIHYPENQKSRVSNGKCDFLYSVKRGVVEKYNQEIHGLWEIYNAENGKYAVRKAESKIEDNIVSGVDPCEVSTDVDNDTENKDFTFALESLLRDFIAENLPLIDNSLSLFVSDDGIVGVEYRTEVGNIDILAQNKNDEFVVIELKLSRGTDVALGQLQRYMGWVKKNLSENNTPVHGIIIGKSITSKLKYAVSVAQNVSLFEYAMRFDISKI